MTLDFFLTVYKQTQRQKELVLSLPVEKIELEKKENCINIKYVKHGFFWNSGQKYSILMESHDLEALFCQHEHFCHIIKVGKGSLTTLHDVLE